MRIEFARIRTKAQSFIGRETNRVPDLGQILHLPPPFPRRDLFEIVTIVRKTNSPRPFLRRGN